MAAYKVVVEVIHDNGDIQSHKERFFTDKKLAMKYAREHEGGIYGIRSVSWVFVYETRTDWFPVMKEEY